MLKAEPSSGTGNLLHPLNAMYRLHQIRRSIPSDICKVTDARSQLSTSPTSTYSSARTCYLRCSVQGSSLIHACTCSVNGVVRAFDPLAATLIRTFSERSASRHPSRLLAAGQADEEDEERYAVANISATRDAVVASIGGKILAWKLTESKAKSKSKWMTLVEWRKRHAHTASGNREIKGWREDVASNRTF